MRGLPHHLTMLEWLNHLPTLYANAYHVIRGIFQGFTNFGKHMPSDRD